MGFFFNPILSFSQKKAHYVFSSENFNWILKKSLFKNPQPICFRGKILWDLKKIPSVKLFAFWF